MTMPGTVEKIIPAVYPNESDKAQIAVDGAEELYREIRVPNVLQDEPLRAASPFCESRAPPYSHLVVVGSRAFVCAADVRLSSCP